MKVAFEVPAGDWHEAVVETMWARPLAQSQYRLESIPIFARGVSFADVVSAHPAREGLTAHRVVQRGGHSTYRLFLSPPTSREKSQRSLEPLLALGCSYERAEEAVVEGLFAVDVPPDADIFAVYAHIERGAATGLWDFEESDCGHPAVGGAREPLS